MNKELTALETWYLVKKYLNIYHHQAIKENIDVETVEGYPIDIIEKALKALEVLKECFDFEGFDEFIPNGKWFEKDIQEREKLLKEMTK